MPDTTKCPNCAASIDPQDAFCGQCGQRISTAMAAESSTPLEDWVLKPVGAAGPETRPTPSPVGVTRTASSEPTVTRTASPLAPDPASVSSQTAFDITKLDRTARVVGACGLLAFVNSFLPWYKASAEGVQFYSANAWKVHYAWIPMLALLALSVAIALPAFGRSLLPADKIPLIVAGVGLACVVFVLIRWFTYPTANALGFSAGAAFGTYVGLILSVVVTVFGFLADSGPEGMAARIVAAFGRRPG